MLEALAYELPSTHLRLYGFASWGSSANQNNEIVSRAHGEISLRASDVILRTNDNDVMLRINDVILRINDVECYTLSTVDKDTKF